MRFIVLFWLMMATPLWADVPYPKYLQLGSNLGAVTVTPLADGTQQVYINGLEIGGVRAAQVYLHGVYNHKADGSQSVLLSLRFAQAGCFDSWLVIRIEGNRIMPSALFGGCVEIPSWFEADALGIAVSVNHPDPNIIAVSHRFDGQGFTVKNVLPTYDEGSGDAPLPELDWQKWIGRASAQFLQDPQERFRFQYVGFDLPVLLGQMQTSGAIFSDGAFLIGYGCIENPCTVTRAVFSVPLFGGYPTYVFHGKNGQRKSNAMKFTNQPERVRRFYYTGVFNR